MSTPLDETVLEIRIIGLSDDTEEMTPLRVIVLRCPGPRFCGRVATRFVRDASPLCSPEPGLVLDFGDVRAIDAAGILAVAGLARACRIHGGVLSLCNATAPVRSLLASIGLHNHADILHAAV